MFFSFFLPFFLLISQLLVQVHVGARSSSVNLNVFEFPVTLPSFCTFLMQGPSDPDKQPPKSSVTFALNESFNSVVEWIERSFILTEQLSTGSGGLQVKFASYKRRSEVVEEEDDEDDDEDGDDEGEGGGNINNIGSGSGRDNGGRDSAPVVAERLWFQIKRDDKIRVKIGCDSMELAGDVIQDMCKCLKVTELESEANFPNEMAKFGVVLRDVTEFHLSRSKLTADMADSSQRVKALVVKAEDARQLGAMAAMKSHYANLFTMNGELIGEYAKRSNNHDALLRALKKVNVMISRASNLRCGKAKTKVVSECRKAIKANNFDEIFSIVQYGSKAKQ